MDALITGLILALVGYAAKYLNDIRLENRRQRIELLDNQLKSLYGPLYSLSNTTEVTWKAFRSRWRPQGAFFTSKNPPTEEELKAWRTWMTEVFFPLNESMSSAIISNAHLFDGENIPEEFLEFIAHAWTYKVVKKNWENSDLSQYTAFVDYPNEFNAKVASEFRRLKRKQAKLIGATR